MKRVSEYSPVRRVLEKANSRIQSDGLNPGYCAVMVEIESDDILESVPNFEGTILYFPGVTAKELIG